MQKILVVTVCILSILMPSSGFASGSKPATPKETSTSTSTDTNTKPNEGKIVSQGSKDEKLNNASDGNAK